MAEAPRVVELWKRALHEFERVLALEPGPREQALAAIRESQPQLHAHVLTLLNADAAADDRDFLRSDAVDALGAAAAAAAAPDRELEAGAEIGGYRLVRSLGAGGMGDVWLAERDHGRYRRTVALKVLHPHLGTRQVRERFAREGQFLAKLSHPNIAQLVDAGSGAAGELYLALEYVDGARIDAWCDARRLDVRARLALFLQVCRAVAHAHAHLVVHRDLKPANVLVTADGTVKLVDFGIAKLLDGGDEPAALTQLTRQDVRPMTPEYAAPEQVLGQAVTTATDVHALGALLYALLCGRAPFGGDGASAAAVARDVLDVDPPPPSQIATRAESTLAEQRGTTRERLARALRGDLDDVVAKAMRKAPAERYASALALADDVERHLRHAPVSARAGSRLYRVGRYVRRHRTMLGASGIAIAALVGGLAIALWQADAARDEARRAAAVRDFALDIFRQNSITHPDGASARETTAEELLAIGAERIATQLQDLPAARAEMLETIGGIYEEMQLLDRALPLYEQRIAALVAAYGPDDPRTADGRAILGLTYSYSGRYPEGERHLNEALRVLDAEPEAFPRTRGHARLALGYAAMRTRPRETIADAHFAAAREIFLRYAPDDEGLPQAERALGRMLEARNDFVGAERYVRAALPIAEKSGNRVQIAGGKQVLARVLRQRRHHDEARGLIERSVAEFEAQIGPDATLTSDARREYGLLLLQVGETEAALRTLERAARTLERERGLEDGEATALAQSDLGAALWERGRVREARDWQLRSIRASRSKEVPGPHLAIALSRLVRLELHAGHPDAAQPLIDEYRALVRERHGEAHAAYGEADALAAELLLARGSATAAADAFAAVLRRWPAPADGIAPLYVRASDGLVRAALAAGDAARAERAARELHTYLASLQAPAAPTPAERALADLRLGEALCAAGRGADARPLLESAVALRTRLDDPASVWLDAARGALATCGVGEARPPRPGNAALTTASR